MNISTDNRTHSLKDAMIELTNSLSHSCCILSQVGIEEDIMVDSIVWKVGVTSVKLPLGDR